MVVAREAQKCPCSPLSAASPYGHPRGYIMRRDIRTHWFSDEAGLRLRLPILKNYAYQWAAPGQHPVSTVVHPCKHRCFPARRS